MAELRQAMQRQETDHNEMHNLQEQVQRLREDVRSMPGYGRRIYNEAGTRPTSAALGSRASGSGSQ